MATAADGTSDDDDGDDDGEQCVFIYLFILFFYSYSLLSFVPPLSFSSVFNPSSADG